MHLLGSAVASHRIARREFVALIVGAALYQRDARAQQVAKVYEIGILYPGPQGAMPPRITAIRSGLRAGGLQVEQFEVVSRAAGGDPANLSSLAADLVSRNVDVICALSPAAVRSAKKATAKIPIVAIDLESDPVDAGFIASVTRPDGNVTGLFLDFRDFSKKWLEVLKEALPQLKIVAVLWDPATGPYQLKSVKAAAETLGITLVVLKVSRHGDLEPAFDATIEKNAGAVLMLSSPVIAADTKLLAGLALQHKLPSITLYSEFARDGGLMSYGPNLLGMIRQAGVMTAKILLGASPATTPIEVPAKFQFVLNLKTAKAIGLNLPPAVLLRADEVIE